MVMERLNAAGVRGAEVTLMNPDDPSYSSDYPQIDSEGNTDGDNYQRLRVTLTQTSSSELENIKLLISSTGTLTVTDAENHYHTGTDFFASSTPAEVKYDEGKPYVLLHVKINRLGMDSSKRLKVSKIPLSKSKCSSGETI